MQYGEMRGGRKCRKYAAQQTEACRSSRRSRKSLLTGLPMSPQPAAARNAAEKEVPGGEQGRREQRRVHQDA